MINKEIKVWNWNPDDKWPRLTKLVMTVEILEQLFADYDVMITHQKGRELPSVYLDIKTKRFRQR